MCNLYSQTKGQQAILELTRAMRDSTGNLPMQPGIFPDYSAPIVRNAPDGSSVLRTLCPAQHVQRQPRLGEEQRAIREALFQGEPEVTITWRLANPLGAHGSELPVDEIAPEFEAVTRTNHLG